MRQEDRDIIKETEKELRNIDNHALAPALTGLMHLFHALVEQNEAQARDLSALTSSLIGDAKMGHEGIVARVQRIEAREADRDKAIARIGIFGTIAAAVIGWFAGNWDKFFR